MGCGGRLETIVSGNLWPGQRLGEMKEARSRQLRVGSHCRIPWDSSSTWSWRHLPLFPPGQELTSAPARPPEVAGAKLAGQHPQHQNFHVIL